MNNIFKGISKESGNSIIGQLIKADDKTFIIKTDISTMDIEGGFSLTQFEEVIPKTVGQYIGINTEQGEKIFVGDIVDEYRYDNEKPSRGVVLYMESVARFVFLLGDDCCGIELENRKFDVVGNIHTHNVENMINLKPADMLHLQTLLDGYDGYFNKEKGCHCYSFYDSGRMGCPSFCWNCQRGYLDKGNEEFDYTITNIRPNNRS